MGNLMEAKKQAGKQGFTLIEVLIVVVIIGVLASLIIPRMLGSPEKAKMAEAYGMVGALIRAEQKYMDTSGLTTPVAFLCPPNPSTCTLPSSLGMGNIIQKDFRYGCDTWLGDYYCVAYRSVAGTPYIAHYYTGALASGWYCDQGYVTADTGVAGLSAAKGCQPNW